jgi:hypothetical protein
MTFEERLAQYIDNRSDPKLSGDRHDEIITLRLFLYELAEVLKPSYDPLAIEALKRIEEKVKTWGKPGDVV